RRVSFLRKDFFRKRETLAKDPKLFQDQEDDVKLKEIQTNSTDNDSYLDRSFFEFDRNQNIGRILSQGSVAPEKNYRTKRQVLMEYNATWSQGVFYVFNTSDHAVQKVFRMGVKVWSESTCVDFKEDRNAQDKVVVVKDSVSFSDVGRFDGEQLLSISDDEATEGTAVHEIGHALGLFHTMVRYDRDNYIEIVKNNLDPNCLGNFLKLKKNFADVYGLTYDYGSIMHYEGIRGSINGLPTMLAKIPNYQMTMGSPMISFSDIYMINQHYGCNAICNKSTSANCVNEGYPHPRNCSMCICPSGYGGALCDRRAFPPPGCGEYLVATSEKQTQVCRIGFGSNLRDHFIFCNYMITAPKGKRIEIDIKSISPDFDEPGCLKGGVEVKAQADQKLTGYRFCSINGTMNPIVSSSDRVPVILFNKFAVMQALFTYRHV
ncbi:hypothetical protein Angca_010251, partial [Angiostrongylus cantonensis]